MSDYEYVIEVLATPVYTKTLMSWQSQTQKQMTEWYGQLQDRIFVHEPVYPDDLYDFSRKQPGMEQELYGFPQC